MAALRATPAALSLNPTEYAAIQMQLLKKKSIFKSLYGFCDQIKQNSQIQSMQMFLRTLEKSDKNQRKEEKAPNK